ncbi:hypothetical protein D4764_05G0000580, partial [Takifugu flavidus]
VPNHVNLSDLVLSIDVYVATGGDVQLCVDVVQPLLVCLLIAAFLHTHKPAPQETNLHSKKRRCSFIWKDGLTLTLSMPPQSDHFLCVLIMEKKDCTNTKLGRKKKMKSPKKKDWIGLN